MSSYLPPWNPRWHRSAPLTPRPDPVATSPCVTSQHTRGSPPRGTGAISVRPPTLGVEAAESISS